MTPLSGCWRIEIARRRACRSPRLASVISFSTSGLTALALASVVLIRSWSMTSLHRLRNRAFRWAAERESLCRVFWWRMAALIVAQAQPARVQGLDDFVDRLLAEVRDRRQLALALGDEVADGLNPRTLEAVVRAHAELELLDQDLVHAAGRASGRAGSPRRGGAG